jgi:uncharacterized delta-60 repeat protein
MGRKLYFPVTGLPPGKIIGITQGGTSANNAPEALANLDGVPADKLNQANGVIKLNSNIKIDNERIPPGYAGAYIGPMLEGLTSLSVNQQALYVINDYDEFMSYSLAAISGSVSRSGANITYTAPGNIGSGGFTLNGKTYNINIVGNNTINQPTITSPANGATGQPNNITFIGSAFSVNIGSDTHYSSDWQIATDSNFTNIVEQITDSQVNKTSWMSSLLTNNTQYYVRVRYKGTNYGYSAWSPTITVTTAAVASYNVSVAGGTITEGQSVTFNINTSNVANNTTLYWSIDQAPSNSTNNSDFISATNGSVVINNNTGAVVITTLADLLLEGTENFIFSLRSGSVAGPVLATFNNNLLDTSYTLAGTKSISAYNKYDNASKVVNTPDDGILIAGICFNPAFNKEGVTLIKLNSNNELDNTFGTNGKLYISETNSIIQTLTAKYIWLTSLNVRTITGDIFVTGVIVNYNSSGLFESFIIKLNSNGSRDSTFGTNGIMVFNLITELSAHPTASTYLTDSVLDQSTGDLHLGMTFEDNYQNIIEFAYVKLTTSTGQLTILDSGVSLSNGHKTNTVITKTFDNKVILFHGVNNTQVGTYTVLNNYTDNITKDSTQLDQIYNYSIYEKVDIASFQSDGGFVILNKLENELAYVYSQTNTFRLVAFNSDLTVRTSFGTNGKVDFPINLNDNWIIRSLKITNSKIYVIGSYKATAGGSYQSFAVICFNLNGSLDTTFGTNGYSIVSINSKDDYGRDAVYSDFRNKLVVVGDTDILITSSNSYQNPHNKSGSVGTLQTEIGVIFLDNTGNLA